MILQEEGEGRLNRSVPGKLLHLYHSRDPLGDTKTCSRCVRKLPLENFYMKRKSGAVYRSDYRAECKECWLFYLKQRKKKRG